MNTPDSHFLVSTDVIDWQHDSIKDLALQLASHSADVTDTSERCFEWVRDNIRHSSDCQLNPVTCAASEVLAHGTGYCFAKSHLLAALLRANGIPAGFCYQRLSMDGVGSPYCLHGFNAVYLPEVDWYRVDARGNRSGIDAAFCPPTERLAFTVTLPGEKDFPEIWHSPLEVVVNSLRTHSTWDALYENLPDVETIGT